MSAVSLRCLVEIQLAEEVGDDRLVLLLEDARIVAERVLAGVVAILGDLIDEEQR